MKKTILLAGCMLLGGGVQADMRELSFYEVKPAGRAPVIDGRMSDPLWASAAAHTNYYEYFKSDPGPSALKSEFRMLYDARGIYLGIRNYDGNMAGLRKNITDRGNVALWTDDCAELYFEGVGHGGGFRCFKSNALGTVDEMNRLDAAVVVGEWRGTGWFVKTSIHSDHWIIEGFFPWDDIGRKGAEGDVIRFCHVRYAYSSGKFQGATSSPGGSYASPHSFGYLYLGGARGQLEPRTVARILGEAATPPWGLAAGDRLISDAGDGPRIESLADAVAAAAARLAELDRLVAQEVAAAKPAPLRQEHERQRAATLTLSDKPDASFASLQALHRQTGKLEDLRMRVMLEKEFN